MRHIDGKLVAIGSREHPIMAVRWASFSGWQWWTSVVVVTH
jgi:hypothetical protein